MLFRSAVYVFYVTDLTNKKIVGKDRQTAIRARLDKVVAGTPPPAKGN